MHILYLRRKSMLYVPRWVRKLQSFSAFLHVNNVTIILWWIINCFEVWIWVLLSITIRNNIVTIYVVPFDNNFHLLNFSSWVEYILLQISVPKSHTPALILKGNNVNYDMFGVSFTLSARCAEYCHNMAYNNQTIGGKLGWGKDFWVTR